MATLGGTMHFKRLIAGAAVLLAGCSTNTTPTTIDVATLDTLALCRALTSTDVAHSARAAEILVKRGATIEKCNRLIAADGAIATGILIAGVGIAAGAAGGSGGSYSPPVYGVAWDAFQNQFGQYVWRCRDRATGQFVDDYRCGGLALHDYTWPGPYI